jgi:hypothetical protein
MDEGDGRRNMNWRRLHNEELYGLYFSPDDIRVIKSGQVGGAGGEVLVGDRRNVDRVWVWKPCGKKLLGRPRRR